MLPALALVALTAADQPPVAVLIASKRAGADAFATKVAAKVHQTLVTSTPGALDDAAASKTVKTAKACQGATDCLIKAAQQLGPKAVVIGVDVGKVAKTLAVHLEAVAADGKEPLAIADFSAPADAWEGVAMEPINAFVKQVTEKLAAPAVAKADEIKRPSDAPQDTQLTPPPEPAPAPAVTASRSSSSGVKLLPIVVVAGAAAVLIVSGVFALLGNNEKGVIDRSLGNNGTTSELTQAEFNRHRSAGNMYFTISLSTALVGLVLGAAGGVLFAL